MKRAEKGKESRRERMREKGQEGQMRKEIRDCEHLRIVCGKLEFLQIMETEAEERLIEVIKIFDLCEEEEKGIKSDYVVVESGNKEYKSSLMGKIIGDKAFNLAEVRSFVNLGGKQGRHIRILAEIDISRALMRGTIVRMNGISKWIQFRYERCPNFCYKYGIIGHVERVCPKENSERSKGSRTQFGVWMRAINLKTTLKKKSLSNNHMRTRLKSKEIIPSEAKDPKEGIIAVDVKYPKGESQNQKGVIGGIEDSASVRDSGRQLQENEEARGIRKIVEGIKGPENIGRYGSR
ncbi:hypothetical protein ACH5RR_007254 [Cinchona calisaya]|uniref:Zinc knuckle CX2CX4HX4C domain-containing protein n=1 Tax=Cinchona calisaya TaxID=153742 RepID=A0ABD3ARL5_9GENT